VSPADELNILQFVLNKRCITYSGLFSATTKGKR
jgi:hypothetical protein